jgi:hypothetical protein
VTTSVYVCRKCDGGRRLAERLDRDDDLSVRAVGCQKICSHHVVGVRAGGTVTWFRKIDSKQRRKALRRYIAAAPTADVPGPLRRLTVAKRAGHLRH